MAISQGIDRFEKQKDDESPQYVDDIDADDIIYIDRVILVGDPQHRSIFLQVPEHTWLYLKSFLK